MTRLEKELNGDFGAYWKKDAEERIEKAKLMWENDMKVDEDGVARWKNSGNVITKEIAEMVARFTCYYDFSPCNTTKAREEENEKFIEAYRHRRTEINEEERYEMEAAFGKGTVVVDIFTGKKVTL